MTVGRLTAGRTTPKSRLARGGQARGIQPKGEHAAINPKTRRPRTKTGARRRTTARSPQAITPLAHSAAVAVEWGRDIAANMAVKQLEVIAGIDGPGNGITPGLVQGGPGPAQSLGIADEALGAVTPLAAA